MSKTIRFKIALIESNPLIWRSFQVTDNYRFDRFHQVIQIVMGWQNYHLHEFRIKDRLIGMLDDWTEEYSPGLEDETRIYLRDLKLEEKDAFTYVYDFGDDWTHVIFVEYISPATPSDPVCVAGERACPPEDCGGIGGYSELLNILEDPSHTEHKSYKTWLPSGFDPKYFSLEAVNKELKKFGAWHRKHPRKKSTPWHQLK